MKEETLLLILRNKKDEKEHNEQLQANKLDNLIPRETQAIESDSRRNNLSRPIAYEEIKVAIRNYPQRKAQAPMALLLNSTKDLKQNYYQLLQSEGS